MYVWIRIRSNFKTPMIESTVQYPGYPGAIKPWQTFLWKVLVCLCGEMGYEACSHLTNKRTQVLIYKCIKCKIMI